MAEYRVVSQVDRNEIEPDSGEVEPGRRVTFKDLQTGVVSSIFVPKTVYSESNVKLLIEHELTQIRAVHSLGG